MGRRYRHAVCGLTLVGTKDALFGECVVVDAFHMLEDCIVVEASAMLEDCIVVEALLMLEDCIVVVALQIFPVTLPFVIELGELSPPKRGGLMLVLCK